MNYVRCCTLGGILVKGGLSTIMTIIRKPKRTKKGVDTRNGILIIQNRVPIVPYVWCYLYELETRRIAVGCRINPTIIYSTKPSHSSTTATSTLPLRQSALNSSLETNFPAHSEFASRRTCSSLLQDRTKNAAYTIGA